MLIPKLNLRCDLIGCCVATENGCEITSSSIMHSLEGAVGEIIAKVYVFCDRISTIVIEVDNDELNHEILENLIGFAIELSFEEKAYIYSLMHSFGAL